MSTAINPGAAGEYTARRAARFYIPLLIQAFSQSLTYPLVAPVVSRGVDGVDGYTAFALGQTVMFMVGALGGGLVTTGMVFGRTRRGLANFKKLNFFMAAVLLVIQLAICAPPLDRFVFSYILELPEGLWQTARNTLFLCQAMQFAFFLRNVPIVVLFNARNGAAANFATMARIAVTAAAAPLFVYLDLVGPAWGCLAMTLPIYLEMLLANCFAKRYAAALPEAAADDAPMSAQLRFTLPLSIGGVLQAASPFMVGAFVSRSEEAVRMYAVHIVTAGAANPFAYAALRMQSVVVAFRPENSAVGRMFRFAFVSGTMLALPLLLLAAPGVSDWYFISIQNLPRCDLPLACIAAAAFALLPLLQSLRGWTEGMAACSKMPQAIMTGQFTYLSVLTLSLAVMHFVRMRGCFMGVCAMIIGVLCTIIVENKLLKAKKI